MEGIGVIMPEEFVYYCEENENVIHVNKYGISNIEILFGNPAASGYGWVVIGFTDLQRALNLAGYEIAPIAGGEEEK